MISVEKARKNCINKYDVVKKSSYSCLPCAGLLRPATTIPMGRYNAVMDAPDLFTIENLRPENPAPNDCAR